MKKPNKIALGFIFSAIVFILSPLTSYCVDTPKIISITVNDEDSKAKKITNMVEPVESTIREFEAESIMMESVKIEPRLIKADHVESNYISDEDLYLLALLTMAEAEGECEEGKRLVVDTVLNRVDSEHFPDTISEVIYQKNQFTSMCNGRVDRVDITEEVVRLIEEEVQNRTNCDVIFFHADRYGNYGTPMFSVGNHYFSSYE